MSHRYREFYSRYKNKLFSYLVHKSGDREVARDIMQESFTRHFQHYGNDTVISPALLFTIARNALADHYRHNARFRMIENITPQIGADEEESLLRKEQAARINRALDALPEQDREILSLAVSGMPYREIAIFLGISEANVKVRVHRARTRLRQKLQDEME